MRPRSISYRVALGGIIASLCLLAMFLTGVIPIFYILLPMIAGLLLSIMVTETGTRWALLTYLSVGVLYLFMTPNKDAAMIFLLFFGHYPIVVPFLQKIRLPFLRILLKLLLFNGCMLAYFGIMVYVLGIHDLLEQMGEFGRYGAWMLLGTANMMFLCYDYTMKNSTVLYERYLKPKIYPKQ